MSDKSAVYILNHQMNIAGYIERFIYSIASTIAVIIVLRIANYSQRNHVIWELVALSFACGAAAGLSRCIQMKHRLYATVHECFYIYFHFFVIAFCMTFRFSERFNMPQEHEVKSSQLNNENRVLTETAKKLN